MSFKKVAPEVKEALLRGEIESLNPLAKQLFSGIKAGGNLLCIGETGSGKTTACIVAMFNKINQQFEGSPRAIYMTNTIDKAEAIHQKMEKIAWPLDVTVDLVHDKGNMLMQRNEIFNGTEIVVGNPKRVYDLYLQNGINFNLVEYFIIDDFETALAQNLQMQMKRMLEGLNPKAQIIFVANATHKKMDAFMESLELPFKLLKEA